MNDKLDQGTRSDRPERSDATIEHEILERFEELGVIDEPATACEMLEAFLINSRDLHVELEDSIQQSDPQLCRSTAHTLKGASRSIGAKHLGDLWFDLEQRANAGDLTDAHDLNTAAQAEFRRVEKFLLELKDDLRP